MAGCTSRGAGSAGFLAGRIRPPTGHRIGERAATDILALAGRGRAFRSLDRLIARQGVQHVLFGGALALSAAVQGWINGLTLPSPACRQVWSGLGAAEELVLPTRHPVTCAKCRRLRGLLDENHPEALALFTLPQAH